jgi:hypothetical protein
MVECLTRSRTSGPSCRAVECRGRVHHPLRRAPRPDRAERRRMIRAWPWISSFRWSLRAAPVCPAPVPSVDAVVRDRRRGDAGGHLGLRLMESPGRMAALGETTESFLTSPGFAAVGRSRRSDSARMC